MANGSIFSINSFLQSRLKVLEVKTTTNGGFDSVLKPAGSVWLVIGQHYGTNDGCVLVAHLDGTTTRHFTEIYKSSTFSYQSNAQGTIQFLYNGTTNDIYACALRLV